MEENSKEDSLDNSGNQGSDHPSEENAFSSDLETIGPKQETENMEVHHHPNLRHEKKNWLEYLLEFLMIFLAVTMGFFAEQIRERYVEGEHEQQSMISLAKDLESDTLQFNRIIKFHEVKISRIDSLLVYFAGNSFEKIPVYQYGLVNKLFGHMAFFQNSGTLDQLNNSGGLRLIRKRKVVDSIDAYVQQVKRLGLRDIYETDFMIDFNKQAQKVFSGKSALKIFTDSVYFNKQILPGEMVKMNDIFLDEFLNNLLLYRSFMQTELSLQLVIDDRAKNLLALIKNEYHIE